MAQRTADPMEEQLRGLSEGLAARDNPLSRHVAGCRQCLTEWLRVFRRGRANNVGMPNLMCETGIDLLWAEPALTVLQRTTLRFWCWKRGL